VNRSQPSQRGSASLWLLGFVMVFWVVAAGGVGVGQAMIARHRAAAAADLGVLAGAQVVADAAVEVVGSTPGAGNSTSWLGGGAGSVTAATRAAACARAVSVVAANGAAATSCTVTASAVQLVAAVSVAGLGRLVGSAASISATARAGWS
jgi:hypothetical protein